MNLVTMLHVLAQRRFIAAVVMSLMAVASHAQTLRNPQWRSLASAGDLTSLEQVALARLNRAPEDGDAWFAYATAMMAQPDRTRRESALARLTRCTEATPRLAACHYGVAAMSVTLLTAEQWKGSEPLTRVHDEFARAVEIEPDYFPARRGLVNFYLRTPVAAGGSVAKAHDAARGAAPRQPAWAQLLTAIILAHEDRTRDVESVLASIDVDGDVDVAAELSDQWSSLGERYLETGDSTRAAIAFGRAAKAKPDGP